VHASEIRKGHIANGEARIKGSDEDEDEDGLRPGHSCTDGTKAADDGDDDDNDEGRDDNEIDETEVDKASESDEHRLRRNVVTFNSIASRSWGSPSTEGRKRDNGVTGSADEDDDDDEAEHDAEHDAEDSDGNDNSDDEERGGDNTNDEDDRDMRWC